MIFGFLDLRLKPKGATTKAFTNLLLWDVGAIFHIKHLVLFKKGLPEPLSVTHGALGLRGAHFGKPCYRG